MRAINSPCSCLLLAKMDSGKFRRSAVRLPDKIDHACFRFVASFNRPDKLLQSPPPVGDGDHNMRRISLCAPESTEIQRVCSKEMAALQRLSGKLAVIPRGYRTFAMNLISIN